MWLRPGDDLSVPLELRQKVFQEELGLSKEQDQDNLDAYAFHLVLLLNDVPVATGRISYAGVGMAKLSRICVLKKYRRQGIGDGLVKVLDYKASQLSMQYSQVETTQDLERFYQKIGYQRTGMPYEKYGMEVISMQKETNDGTRENCANQCACT
jgi:predicted GNAT family N-acyltransferase